jgi:tRNA C32,U32 (ribose-2'-O)-methylase TrmJ
MATAVEQITEMAMKLRLSKQASEKLLLRATESGRDVADVASDLIEQAVTRPTLEELLAPVQAEFAKTGMSEEEIMELGRREPEALRKEKADRA